MNYVILLLTLGLTTASLSVSTAYAQEFGGGVDIPGDWWLGEGLKQGDQFSYRLCFVDYKECTFFEIDFWIEGEKQVGSESKWLAKAVVYDGHKVLKGDIEFGKVTAEPTGGSDNLVTHRSALKSSISWLSSFATSYGGEGGEGPKAFDMPSWGKIGNIGGQQVRPLAIESVTVPAGTFDDAIKIGWRTGGTDSFIWLLDEFPFPLKASTWTHVAEGQPPQEYAFTLLNYQENVSSNPFIDIKGSDEEQIALGCPNNDDLDFKFLKKASANFEYGLEVGYKPEQPKQGCDIEWLIKFKSKYDETEFLNQVQYDIMVVDDKGTFPPIRNLAADENKQFLYSPSGLAERTMVVKEPVGENNYLIIIYGLAPEFSVPDFTKTPTDSLQIPITIAENNLTNPDVDDDDPIITIPPSETKIPGWVKNNAGLWSDALIDDNTFVLGIQYLIQERIIEIPPTEQGTDSGDNQIPGWVKNNAGLWSDALIDDNTFVLGIQYLIQEGIMKIFS